jgi:hypothetical protein
MKKPWRKLYISTPNDEKLRFMITKYGHECSFIWMALLTRADDDGVVSMERDVLAYLCIVDEARLGELLTAFSKKGFISIADDESITIVNWHEYQDVESESAERVRNWREKKRAVTSGAASEEPKTDNDESSPSNVTVTLLKREVKRQDIDIEEDKEKEKEYKTEAPVFLLSDELNPNRTDGTTRIETARQIWNAKELKPPCRYTPLNFRPDILAACLATIKVYTDDEIENALENYSGITRSPEHAADPEYKSFEGFLAAGVSKYAADADPWTRCLRNKTGPAAIGDQVREAMRNRKKIPPPPEKCPHCEGTIRHTTDSAGCKCGAMWELHEGAWKQIQKSEEPDPMILESNLLALGTLG